MNRGVNLETRFDGISEFISRRGRMEVLNSLLDEIETPAEVARMLDISKNAVYGWINEKERHPSNENVKKMLEILNREKEDILKYILVEELQTFQDLILKF